jgi:exodeoxyribonuclease V alpha subunit
MITLSGTVTAITFRNEDNGFTIIRLKPANAEQHTHVCVGTLTTIDKGQSLRLTGDWENHKRFGPQFVVKSYEIVKPTTVEGIASLLGSGLIANIGPVRAKKIIDAFGLNTLDILDNHPRRLLEIEGIGRKYFEKIHEAWQRQKYIRELMLFLQDADISITMAYKIYKAYGQNAQECITKNPYRLIDDIWGVGFKKADAIAQKMGFAHDSFQRIRAGLTHTIQEATGNGHTYLPKNDLVAQSVTILEVPEELVQFTLDHCITDRVFTALDDRVYLPVFYEAEQYVANTLAKRLRFPGSITKKYPPEYIDSWLKNYCATTNWSADPKQLEAVAALFTNSTLILTGGPGTGKTTTLQVVVEFFRKHNIMASLAAPTGRAAQRMGSIAGIKASTIHRLLEFKPGKNRVWFNRNENNPLDTGVLIVDEVSMIDIMLMRSLLCAVKPETLVLFVGDSNQLPSVGAGNVLADMITSGRIPHVGLTTIFRQAAQSRIVIAAHEIIHGNVPSFSNAKDSNCFFIKESDPERCLSTIVELVTQRLPRTYGYNPIFDIQVLAPMHRGILGTQNINRILHTTLLPNAHKLVRGEQSFAVNDRVMQIRNNYDLGVFNGDIGYIKQINDSESTVLVEFDNEPVTYEYKDLDELVHAYCISIHKSQGCEFKAVIIIMTTQHYIMLQRNLLYTALTRARELCIIIGTPNAIDIAVHNNEAFHRYSRLSEAIGKAADEL